MTVPQYVTYARIDVSSNTDLRVCGDRTLSPRGAIIHTTGGVDSREWLQGQSANAGSAASADALIERSGRQLLLLPQGKFAYHAGISVAWADREYRNSEVNQAFIGIELECLDTERPTWPQYDSLADLILYFARLYGWAWPMFIYGHYAVARPLGRRSDPVNYDWGDLMGRLYVRSVAMQLPGME